MYRELAAIMDGDTVTGFVTYDGSDVVLMDMEDMKEAAAAGLVDTLEFHDGRFVPVVKGSTAEELSHYGPGVLRRTRKIARNMDFKAYLENDCIFRKQDVDAVGTGIPYAVLANICSAQRLSIKGITVWRLELAIWARHPYAHAKVKGYINSWSDRIQSAQGMQDYGGFLKVSLPLHDLSTGFRLLDLQHETDTAFLYNRDMLDGLPKRNQFMLGNATFLARPLLRRMMPTESEIEELYDVADTANLISREIFRKHGIVLGQGT